MYYSPRGPGKLLTGRVCVERCTLQFTCSLCQQPVCTVLSLSLSLSLSRIFYVSACLSVCFTKIVGLFSVNTVSEYFTFTSHCERDLFITVSIPISLFTILLSLSLSLSISLSLFLPLSICLTLYLSLSIFPLSLSLLLCRRRRGTTNVAWQCSLAPSGCRCEFSSATNTKRKRKR